MNILLCKLGTTLKDYDSAMDNSIGHMKEVFYTKEILEKQHNVYMFANKNSKIDEKIKYNNQPIDKIVVFNGPLSKNNTTKFGQKTLQMMERYTYPVIELINNTTCNWYYMNPDLRYHMRHRLVELQREPKRIVTLFGDDDFGLDKLWLYKNNFREYVHKDVFFGLHYNPTNQRKTKVINKILDLVDGEGHYVELRGKYKEGTKHWNGVLYENSYLDWLKNVKYNVCIGNRPNQITSRIWDSYFCDVASFIYDFDTDYKVVPKDDFMRVNNIEQVLEKIKILENDYILYEKILKKQRDRIREEYIDGSYILNKYNEMFKEI